MLTKFGSSASSCPRDFDSEEPSRRVADRPARPLTGVHQIRAPAVISLGGAQAAHNCNVFRLFRESRQMAR